VSLGLQHRRRSVRSLPVRAATSGRARRRRGLPASSA